MVKEQILPGYFLVMATKEIEEWPKGWYGLVQCNDPDFVWKGRPRPLHLYNLSDKEIKAIPIKTLKKWNKEEYKFIDEIEDQFVTDPMKGYQLVAACKKAGYNPKKHGYNVLMWLMDYMGRKLKEKQ
jgi:hypothetical protein